MANRWRICPKCNKPHRLAGFLCAMCYTLAELEFHAAVQLR